MKLPGRLSDHVKQRFLIKLDPEKKTGAWDESEMKILIDSQKELGNKWCEIAKRIPGRNELSVKNRWYNQILSDKRAAKRGIIRDSIISLDSKPSAKSSSITNEEEEATASLPPNKKQKRTWLCDVCQEETFDDYDKAVEHEKTCTLKKVQFNERGLNDVLFGRGGVANHNPGNKKFRELVDKRKDEYKTAKQGDKGSIARDIVKAWRAQDPPGQFLKKDEITKLWSDVGDEMAVQKTSQTLRENKKKKKDEENKDDSCQLAEATI